MTIIYSNTFLSLSVLQSHSLKTVTPHILLRIPYWSLVALSTMSLKTILASSSKNLNPQLRWVQPELLCAHPDTDFNRSKIAALGQHRKLKENRYLLRLRLLLFKFWSSSRWIWDKILSPSFLTADLTYWLWSPSLRKTFSYEEGFFLGGVYVCGCVLALEKCSLSKIIKLLNWTTKDKRENKKKKDRQ